MRSVSRPVQSMLAVLVGLMMSAVFSATAASAPPSPADQDPAPPAATWDLSGGVQRLCIPAGSPYTSYFVGFVAGAWDTPLLPEVHGLPEGTVVSMTQSVPPDDNGDQYIGVIWILVQLPPLDYGEYPAVLTVTDGTSTQTMGILIKAQEKWGC
ncbi:DUF5980 family protein [Glycomyces harbinensis]|uniref:Uncharacterized protein n=1 Tax=Glycomyces harbinensis TaxID=58114 RepID=A0A1G7DFL1_9ACTN|nr:DUF5980 family protein [Glycomyces harbinensis]SDE49595.1 hypothetical protein SAMN05216270_12443 [Glycomyces harbinensis]